MDKNDQTKKMINDIIERETARIVVENLDNEEIASLVRKTANELLNNTYYCSNGNFIEFAKEYKRLYMERFRDAVGKYLESEQIQADIDQKAREVVQKIREETERKIIESVSDRIAMVTTGYNGVGLSQFVYEAVGTILKDNGFR